MILIYMIVPVLILCLDIIYAMLIRRFFLIKEKLPIMGVRGVLVHTKGKRWKIASLGALFFAIYLAAQQAVGIWAPSMLMVLNYEEAA